MSSRQILDILSAGRYDGPSGRTVSIKDEQADSEANTRLYSSEQLEALRSASPSGARFSTCIEIVAATTQP